VEIKVARPDHPEVREVIASHHCVQRFRKRIRIKAPGIDIVEEKLRLALQEADFSRWPPAWIASDRQTEMWALVDDDIAFPLTPTSEPGRWLAMTCLVRGGRR
jgi:hypothetical protein